jgi:protein SCO1
MCARWWLWLAGVLALGCGASGGPVPVSAGVATPVTASADAPFVHRSELIDPVPVQDFTLTDHTGTPLRFGSLHGDVAAIGFVYSTCPDICGQVRTAFLTVQEQCSAQVGHGLELLLVSTDPTRDTPAQVAKYTDVFKGQWRYLTGTKVDLEPVWEQFRVQVRDVDTDGRIDHTWMIALIDRRGAVRFRYFGQDDPSATLIPDIKALLEESP